MRDEVLGIWFSHGERPSIGPMQIKLGDMISTFVLYSIGVGMDTVRVLISERRAQSGKLINEYFFGIVRYESKAL